MLNVAYNLFHAGAFKEARVEDDACIASYEVLENTYQFSLFVCLVLNDASTLVGH